MLGCFTYTSTLSRDLQRGLDVLEEGGRLWIGTTDSVVIYRDDRLMLLPEWLATIDGLEVDFTRPSAITDGAYLYFSAKKTRPDVKVEELDLIFEQSHFPRALSTVHIFAPS